MDQRGEIVIDHVFDDGTGFHEGLAAVRVGKSWGFIDTSGKFAIEPTLYNWCHFQEGLAAICWRGGKWGLIDREGKFTIQPKYSYLGGFNEGLALFKVGEKSSRYGFIDRQGREVIGATFKEGGRFSEGLAAVVLGNLWGYITPTGAFKIAPRFEGSRVTPRGTRHTDAGYFSNGLAPVWSGKGYGFIDTTGAFVSRDDFEMAHSFHEERALIQQEGRFGFVGPNGTVSIKPRFT